MLTNWFDNFEELYQQRGQHRYGIRLLALWKIQDGMSQSDLCELIGKTHKTIRLWRETYESKGLDGLLNIKKGRGRKPRINEKSLIDEAIKELTIENKGGRIRGQDLVDYFASKQGIHYSLSGMYHRLHKLKYSWITSRSKHPKQTPEGIEEFKKKVSNSCQESRS